MAVNSSSPVAPGSSGRTSSATCSRTPTASVTVLDKLTYAGNRESLDGLPDDRLTFVQGDICDTDLVDEARAPTTARRPLRRRVAQRQLAARPVAVPADEPGRHVHAARGGAQARRAFPSRVDRRGLRRPRARRPGALQRDDAVQPVEPVLGDEGRLRSARAGVGAVVRHRGDDQQLLEQLRAVPARREVHPAADHERARRRPAEAVRHGRERARLDPRRRPQLGRAHDHRARASRRDVPHRGRRRAEQQAGRRDDPRAARPARRRLRPRHRPGGPRPALRDRLPRSCAPSSAGSRGTSRSAPACARRSTGTARTSRGGARRKHATEAKYAAQGQ